MLQKLFFDSGERRHVRVRVTPKYEEKKDLDFTIYNPIYEIYKNMNRTGILMFKHGSELIESGSCIIEDHILDAFIAPPDGYYSLIFTYEIADETWSDEILLEVGNGIRTQY